MLPLRSRQLRAQEPFVNSLQARSVIFGMALALVCASLGYLARGGSTAVVTGAPYPPGAAQQQSGAGGSAALGDGGQPLVTSGGSGGGGAATRGATSSGGRATTGATGGPTGTAGGSTMASGRTSAGGGASTGPLRATDQGVTKSAIKLGFLIANTNQLSAAGFNAGLAGDQQKIITAWLNELNRTGGVAGRKVTAYSQTFDVLSADDMQAACKTMTQDQKVFSVITTGGYDSVAQLCIAKENKTPFISTDPEPADWYSQAAPYMWATYMNKDRLAKNWATWLKRSGYVHPDDKVGVIYHDIPNVAPPVERTLLPSLKANGINPVDVVKLASDSNQALAQISNAVLDMHQKGVTLVLFQMNLIFKAKFLQEAEKQQWKPRFSDDDAYFGCADFTTSAYPTNEYDGTQCLGTTLSGIKDPKPTAFTKYADAVYKRTYSQGYATEGSSKSNQDAQAVLNYSLGSEILLWAQAAKRAGTELTRAAWGQAMGQTGDWTQQALYCSQSFGPRKWDGSDRLSVAVYRAAASDGYAAGKFHQLAPGCFDNYF